MKSSVILIFSLILSFNTVFGQPSEIIYQGNEIAAGYLNNIPLASDGPFPIGFTFNFLGINNTQFYVTANGLISFTNPTAYYSSETSIPNSAAPNNFIAPFWDDLVIDQSGQILYTTVGASPNRKLIIQYRNMGFYPFPVFMGTFTVILYETSNVIQMQYRLVVDKSSSKAHGGSATIGIENFDGTAGVEYAFHDSTAIYSGQAISFTPSGPTYIVDSSASYDGVFLTTNLSLPEPGITNLITPTQDAVIGSDQNFQWSESSNATNYSLKISNYSDLTDAVSYDAGANLNYDISGLLLDTTYYWGVFASNATGITWCEIKRFTTSLFPPLSPVSQTIWTEQYTDTIINLQYTGGNESPKTAIINSLPLQGALYQYDSGLKGSQIMTVPTAVTDDSLRVIYSSSGNSGTGAGNFNFKINDSAGDSPVGTITINVSPAGAPNVLYIARSTSVEIQMDVPMTDPSAKENQFTVNVNGSPVTVDSVTFKTGDPYTFVLYVETPLTGAETVLVSYTQGDITGKNGGFLLSFADQPVTITAQTIDFSQSLSKKYTDSPIALHAIPSSGLPMTYSSSNQSVATVSSNLLTFHSAGISDITARQAGNATYAPAKYIKPLTVAKGDQVITFDTLAAKTYGDDDFVLTATSSSGSTVSYISSDENVATITGNTVHITGGGVTQITASQSGNENYNPAVDVPRPLTINKATLTVEANDTTKVFGDENPEFTVSYIGFIGSDNETVLDTIPDITTSALKFNDVGQYAITPSGGSDNSYSLSYTDGTLTIEKAPLTVIADDTTKVYGDVNPEFTVSYSGFKGTDNETVLDDTPVATTSALQYSDVGEYSITSSGGSDNNYSFSYTDGALTIKKAPLNIIADDTTKVYGDVNPVFTVSYSGFKSTDDDSVIDNPPVATTSALQFSDVGEYPITPAGGSDNNYSFSYTSGALTIEKAPLTVIADDTTKVYGDVNQVFTISYSGFKGTDDDSVIDNSPDATTSALQYSDVGEYSITSSGGSDNNYNLSYVDGSLTIEKAKLTVTADNKTKTYGEANPELTVTYSGFKGTDDSTVLEVIPSAATSADESSNAGTYPIVADGGSDNNYTMIYQEGVLTINKADQTITFGSLIQVSYGDNNIVPSATAGSGLAVSFSSDNTDIAVINIGIIQTTGAGDVIITASQQGNENYNPASSVSQTLTVNKADLTFTAENKSKVYLEQNPELTYIISGFVYGETESVLDQLPSMQTTASDNSPVGDYPITFTGGIDNNYSYIYLPGILTVTKIPQTITFSEYPEKLLVEDTSTLVATSTSGLSVLFESMNTNLATVTGDLLRGVSKGNVQIRAYNEGDSNFDPTEEFVTIEIYSSHKEIMHLFTPNNDGFNDIWELPELSSWGKCSVRVYNRWGKLVYANDDYNNLWDGRSNGSPLPEGPYYFIIKTENAGTVKGTLNIVR